MRQPTADADIGSRIRDQRWRCVAGQIPTPSALLRRRPVRIPTRLIRSDARNPQRLRVSSPTAIITWAGPTPPMLSTFLVLEKLQATPTAWATGPIVNGNSRTTSIIASTRRTAAVQIWGGLIAAWRRSLLGHPTRCLIIFPASDTNSGRSPTRSAINAQRRDRRQRVLWGVPIRKNSTRWSGRPEVQDLNTQIPTVTVLGF